MMPKIAVLAGGSLFADGVLSRMRRSYPALEFKVIDLCGKDPLVEILACPIDILVMVQPEAKTITDLQCKLYPVLPHLKVIIIESHSDRARILQWDEQPVSKVGDIMTMINNLVDESITTPPESL